jgi:hypothetical protein
MSWPTLVAALLTLVLASLLPTWARPATDAELLLAFKATFDNGDSVLPSWTGTEPCGGQWAGIICDLSNGTITFM